MASQSGGRVAVCGVSDLIGGQIARRLVEEGVEVRAVDAPGAARWHLHDVDVDWHPISGAKVSRSELANAFAGCGALIIADAPDLSAGARCAHDARRMAIRRVRMRLDAAHDAQVPRIVLISDERTLDHDAVEGAARLPDDSGDPTREALIAMEAEIYRYVASGMHICLVTATMAIGPGDVRGSRVQAFGAARSPADGYLHICDARDLAQVAINAARRGRAGRRYPFMGSPMRVEEFDARCDEHGGAGRPEGALELWPPAWGVSTTQLRSDLSAGELGVRSRPLALTLRDAGRWYRRAGMLLF